MSYLTSADSSNTLHKLSIPGQGTLTGYIFKSSVTNQDSTIRFARVPYALPVTNKDRFKRAKPIPDDFDYTGDYGKVGLKGPQPAVPNPVFNYKKSPSQEDIQYVNIFVPSSDENKPKDGWPVLVYYHGGWLQYNSPNHSYADTSNFNSEFQDKFILVSPGYRLNIFGFLSSKELLEEDPYSSNFGFWDQRLALEWTFKYIKDFGGNPNAISIGGISAGAYSGFFQLAYELYNPDVQQIIKQVAFQSNLVFCQPKTIEETQEQFDEIITKLGLDGLSSSEKLAKLRAISSFDIEDFIPTLDLHTFRAVTDDKFVSSKIIPDLYSGEFVKKLLQKNLRFIIGEVDNEPWKYSVLNTPKTIKELDLQVENYYPAKVIKPLLKLYKQVDTLNESDPEFNEDLRKVYGDIIADGQIYASERGFINQLVKFGFPQERINRYRISYRAKFTDDSIPRDLKVIHALDFSLWFLRLEFYEDSEREIAKNWISSYVDFLTFKDITKWKHSDYKKTNILRPNGEIEYVDDAYWERGVEVADAVYKAQV